MLEARDDGGGARWEAAQVEVNRLGLPCTMSLDVLEWNTGTMGMGSPASAQAVECVATVLEEVAERASRSMARRTGRVTGDGAERPVARRSGSLAVTAGGRACT